MRAQPTTTGTMELCAGMGRYGAVTVGRAGHGALGLGTTGYSLVSVGATGVFTAEARGTYRHVAAAQLPARRPRLLSHQSTWTATLVLATLLVGPLLPSPAFAGSFQPPVFSSTSYSASVNESHLSGGILQVHNAEGLPSNIHANEPNNEGFAVVYSLLSGNNPAGLSIDPATGIVTLQKADLAAWFDYEKENRHVYTIVATVVAAKPPTMTSISTTTGITKIPITTVTSTKMAGPPNSTSTTTTTMTPPPATATTTTTTTAITATTMHPNTTSTTATTIQPNRTFTTSTDTVASDITSTTTTTMAANQTSTTTTMASKTTTAAKPATFAKEPAIDEIANGQCCIGYSQPTSDSVTIWGCLGCNCEDYGDSDRFISASCTTTTSVDFTLLVLNMNDNTPTFVGTPLWFHVAEDAKPADAFGKLQAFDADGDLSALR